MHACTLPEILIVRHSNTPALSLSTTPSMRRVLLLGALSLDFLSAGSAPPKLARPERTRRRMDTGALIDPDGCSSDTSFVALNFDATTSIRSSSNLGGLGPDFSFGEPVIRYYEVGVNVDGRPFDMVLSNASAYFANSPNLNKVCP